MNLARPFKAGIKVVARSRRVATIEFTSFTRRYATQTFQSPFPGLERPG
jgi:hypothetical protein